MFKILTKILVFLYVLTGVFVANTQSASDSKLLSKMTDVLKLDSNQVNSLDSIFTSFSVQLDSLNTKIKDIQTSELTEKEIGEQSSVLFVVRKELQFWKKSQIISILTPEQNALYKKEILAKSSPVVHFGHDKANCKVCIDPQTGAIIKIEN